MTGTVYHRRQARQDLVDNARRYAREAGPGLARRFLDQARDTFGRLAEFPRMGRRYEAESAVLPGLRFFPISGFDAYLVFYRESTTGIEVVRVLHSARDIPSILAAEFGIEAVTDSLAGAGKASNPD
jgi:toxin ParE1/3/4